MEDPAAVTAVARLAAEGTGNRTIDRLLGEKVTARSKAAEAPPAVAFVPAPLRFAEVPGMWMAESEAKWTTLTEGILSGNERGISALLIVGQAPALVPRIHGLVAESSEIRETLRRRVEADPGDQAAFPLLEVMSREGEDSDIAAAVRAKAFKADALLAGLFSAHRTGDSVPTDRWAAAPSQERYRAAKRLASVDGLRPRATAELLLTDTCGPVVAAGVRYTLGAAAPWSRPLLIERFAMERARLEAGDRRPAEENAWVDRAFTNDLVFASMRDYMLGFFCRWGYERWARKEVRDGDTLASAVLFDGICGGFPETPADFLAPVFSHPLPLLRAEVSLRWKQNMRGKAPPLDLSSDPERKVRNVFRAVFR